METLNNVQQLKKKVSNSSKPPSSHYLILDQPITDSKQNIISTISLKCLHKTQGEWAIVWNEVFYRFIDSNQKDIWLGTGGVKNIDDRIQLLRWYCHECCNVQYP